MLDLKFVRENVEVIEQRVKERKQFLDLGELIQYDAERRRLLKEVERLKHIKNVVTEEIGQILRKRQDASAQIEKMGEVSERIKALDEEVKVCDRKIREILLLIPNVPHHSVPAGDCEDDNLEVRKWGQIAEFKFNPRPHWEIGEKLGILDFERAAKITGARFVIYKGAGARLERALINFMLDLHIGENGYKEVLAPFMVNHDAMVGTGQLPKFEEELFKLSDFNYYLIPTAEVSVTNIHREEIIDGNKLPIYYVSYSPCFRREAGSYGKDTRGLTRQHQFNKIELVKFVEPETSYDELESLVCDAQKVLERLGIPYRVVSLCTADLGFASAKTYDLEVWLSGQQKYREISSCSNFEDFQARRAGIKYRPKNGGKVDYVHTLNGSGLAIGRTVAAILENYQNEDGTVNIPEALKPYMDNAGKITKEA